MTIMLTLSRIYVFDFVMRLMLFGFCAAGGKGPFLVVPGEITSCMSNKDPAVTAILKTYERNGKTLLNGSIEFKKDLNDIRFFITFFAIYPDKKKKLYDVRDLKCNNLFTNMIVNTILGTRYVDKTCKFKAGVYNFFDFDMDKVYHQLAVYVLPFGKYNMQLKFKNAGVQLGCLNFPSYVTPLPDN